MKMRGIWVILGTSATIMSLAKLKAEYPELIAYDQNGFEVDLDDLNPEFHKRIMVWENKEKSIKDTGVRAVAEIVFKPADEVEPFL